MASTDRVADILNRPPSRLRGTDLRGTDLRGAVSRASAMTGARLVSASAPFDKLLPSGGLAAGTTTQLSGLGATSLTLALAASLVTDDSWTALVGMPDAGLVAAHELGVPLHRLAVISRPGRRWADVTSALVDAVDVVVVRPSGRVNAADARALAVRVRDRGCVLLVCGAWPVSAEVVLSGVGAGWHGAQDGYGHLKARMLSVAVSGRRVPQTARRSVLWLPDAEGHVRIADETQVGVRIPEPAAARIGAGAVG